MKHIIITISVWFFSNGLVFSQVSTTGNTSIVTSDFLGWDNATTFPLNIRHEANDQPINFWTGGFQRMRINDESSVQTINGFAGIDTKGYLGVSPFANFWADPTGPYSLLHLAGDIGTLEASYRPWMKYGMTITGNGDAMYVGQRILDTDLTEAVIGWGDNSSLGTFGPDHLVFRFTRAYSSLATDDIDVSSETGLQVARMIASSGGRMGVGNQFGITATDLPQRKLHVHDQGTTNTTNAQLRLSQHMTDSYADFRVTTQGNLCIHPVFQGGAQNVGIGNYNPTFKLDVSGTTRLRVMATSEPDVVITGNQVTATGDYELQYRTLSDFVGDLDIPCEWNMITNGTSDDLVMGYSGACNEGNVGIGVNNPTARLDVLKNVAGTNVFQRGMRVTMIGGSNVNIGAQIDLSASPTTINTQTYGISVTSSGSNDKNFGGQFRAMSSNSSSSSTGVYAFATSSVPAANHVGVYGSAANTKFNYGVLGGVASNNYFAEGVGVNGMATSSYALFSSGTRPLFGVRGISNANYDCGYLPVGVYGRVMNVDTVCTVGWAGYFDGNVLVTGTVTQLSDETLKENILEISNGLEIISALNPVSYNFRCDEFPQVQLSDGIKYGFIAQEVQEIIPGITQEVNTAPEMDSLGNVISESLNLLGLNYSQLHAFEVSAIQELITRIEDLEEQLNNCCSESRSHEMQENHQQQKDIHLTNSSIVLNQNVPNPFAEQTMITYKLDDDFSKAQILFYDANGKLIQATDITTKGAGQLNVFADDLTSGVYSYALVVDGKVIETKKMIRQ